MTKTDTGCWQEAFLEFTAPNQSSKRDTDMSGKVPRMPEMQSDSPSSSCLHRGEV